MLIKVFNHIFRFLVFVFEDIQLYKIIDDFSIGIVDIKRILEEIKSFFSISIPVFAEPVASEDFMVFRFGEFQRLLEIFLRFHPMVLFHLKDAFDIESQWIGIILFRIQKIYSFGRFSDFTFSILDIRHLQKRILIVRIPKKNRVDLFDSFIKFSQFLEFFYLIDKGIGDIGRHTVDSQNKYSYSSVLQKASIFKFSWLAKGIRIYIYGNNDINS